MHIVSVIPIFTMSSSKDKIRQIARMPFVHKLIKSNISKYVIVVGFISNIGTELQDCNTSYTFWQYHNDVNRRIFYQFMILLFIMVVLMVINLAVVKQETFIAQYDADKKEYQTVDHSSSSIAETKEEVQVQEEDKRRNLHDKNAFIVSATFTLFNSIWSSFLYDSIEAYFVQPSGINFLLKVLRFLSSIVLVYMILWYFDSTEIKASKDYKDGE